MRQLLHFPIVQFGIAPCNFLVGNIRAWRRQRVQKFANQIDTLGFRQCYGLLFDFLKLHRLKLSLRAKLRNGELLPVELFPAPTVRVSVTSEQDFLGKFHVVTLSWCVARGISLNEDSGAWTRDGHAPIV